jgi:ribosomal RNA-processing protein 17
MLGKRKRAVMVPPPKKRKKNQSAIDEITFDFDARADYLTGFHKRKLQRIKHAQEQAAKLEREEKLAARKAVSQTCTIYCPKC